MRVRLLDVKVLVCVLLLPGLFSCIDMEKITAESTAGMFLRAAPQLEGYFDLQTVIDGFPANIVQLEGIMRIAPDNTVMLFQGTAAYVGYGYLAVESEMEEAELVDDVDRANHLRRRARSLYLRAKDLAFHWMNLESDGFYEAMDAGAVEFDAWLHDEFDDEDDALLLLWVAQAWASFLNMDSENMDTVADLPMIKSLLKRSIELDPDFFYSTGKMAMGIVAASEFPPNVEESKRYFDEALAQTDRGALLIQMNMARFYAVALGDAKLFRELLQEVLDAGDRLPENRLANRAARVRAERYLRSIGQYFPNVGN